MTKRCEEENYTIKDIIKGSYLKKKEKSRGCDIDSMNTDDIASLSDQLAKVVQEIQILKNQR